MSRYEPKTYTCYFFEKLKWRKIINESEIKKNDFRDFSSINPVYNAVCGLDTGICCKSECKYVFLVCISERS